MNKFFKTLLFLAMCIGFLFLTACSSAEEKGEKNIELVLSSIFTVEKDVFDPESDSWYQSYIDYYEGAAEIGDLVSSQDDYMNSKLAIYAPALIVSDRTSSVYKYCEIEENTAANTTNYKDFLLTVYVDCTYTDKDRACEVINGKFSIDEEGKITYFYLEF